MPTPQSEDEEINKNAAFRSSRRAARKRRTTRTQRRRLSVRSELRDEPDVGKIAKAVIALAQAEAERDAQAQAERSSDGEPADE